MNNANKVKISVVTVCFNAADTIEETIKSVVGQTYDNVEYIVIDGGSKDGTVDIIKKYADKIKYWISEPDKGIYDAMNKGIKAATGDYINFMNAGDVFYDKNVLLNVATEINATRFRNIYYGDTIYMYSYGEVFVPSLEMSEISKRLPYCHQSCFVKTKDHKERPFDTSFRYCADYKFAYDSITKYGAVSHRMNLVISKYEAQEGSSSKFFKKTLVELAKARNENQNLKHWMKLYSKILQMQLHNFIKKMLPGKLIKAIQQKHLKQ